MASRLTRSALGAARPVSRPILPHRVLPSTATSLTQSRYQSNVPQQDPKDKAKSILDSVPGSNLISKTAVLSAGAGLSIAAISNEIYVVNEETIIMFSTLSVFWAIYHYLGPSYSQWADSYADKLKGIFRQARQDHRNVVQSRMDSVKKVSEIVNITKDLFAVSKETAQLEAQAYELEQKTALAAEAKSTLDSWVRYEGQMKAKQQKELADSIIAKVDKDLENPRVLKQILDQSVADVERIVSQKTS